MEFKNEPFKSWWREYTCRDHHPWAPYNKQLRPLDGGDSWGYGPSTSGNTTLDDLIVSRRLKWIPYDEFLDVKYVTSGGFGDIHLGTWKDKGKEVVLKSLKDIHNLDVFFNEWKVHVDCLDSFEIANLFGFTKNKNNTYTAVMEYANKGALCNNLEKLSRSSWREKLYVLYKIVSGLYALQSKNLVHCDVHHGNILINTSKDSGDKLEFGVDDDVWITDLGLCKSIKSCMLTKSEVFGVALFMPPEVLNGGDDIHYTTACDVYGISMIMWELTSGSDPTIKNAHLGHAHAVCDGARPEIIEGTPKCYGDLMKKCWDQDPSKRPDPNTVLRHIVKWIFPPNTNEEFLEIRDQVDQFIKADKNQIAAPTASGNTQYCFSSVYNTGTNKTTDLADVNEQIVNDKSDCLSAAISD